MLGVDVSNHQGSLDWSALKTAGVRFAFVKASEGVTFTDATLAPNRLQASLAGIPVGPYHFARPDLNTALAEANHFATVVGSLRRNELRPVLDFEGREGVPSSFWTPTWARDFLVETERLLGVRPLLYSYPDFLRQMGTLGNLTEWPLWLASYGPNDGFEHDAPDVGFRMVCHQYTSEGKVAGLTLDLNSADSLNDLRESGDYLLWRDWRLGGKTAVRPLGLPTTIPLRWQNAYEADAASMLAYTARQLRPLNDQILALQTMLKLTQDTLAATSTSLQETVSALAVDEAKIVAARADLE